MLLRPDVSKRLRIYNLLLISLVFTSCYRYTVVRLDREFSPGLNPLEIQRNSEGASPEIKPVQHKIPVKKYYAKVISTSPVSWMINRGVELAETGKLREAEIMFREAMKEDGEAWAAYNNMGIIYEISGMNEPAFNMYSTACLHEPGNELFRMNFQTFVDSGHDSKK